MQAIQSKNTVNKNFTRAGEVQVPEIYNRRFLTGIEDLDELFGGQGFLPGQLLSIAAGAGTGKSSFLLQMMQAVGEYWQKDCIHFWRRDCRANFFCLQASECNFCAAC